MQDRIRELMESQHMNQQLFANATVISAASLSSIFKGRTKPTLNHVEAIKNTFPNINLNWLMFGSGSMFNSPEQPSQSSTPVTADQDEPIIEPTIDFGGEDLPSSESTYNASNMRGVQSTPKKVNNTVVKIIDKPQRKVASIQVIYDDNTIEIFVPKK